MKLEKVELGETGNFSPIFLDYLKEEEKLKPFYQHPPRISSFKDAISSRSFSIEKREILVESLKNQYKHLVIKQGVQNNIESLKDHKTFTITTGHQLNLFSGPLYFIFKIVTVINACKRLKTEYPDYHFVPIYWMATEDHDFEEINHFNLFGQHHQWNTDQKGAVGRFSTDAIQALIDSIPEKVTLFETAYSKGKTLAEATRFFVNELFGEEGLVVVDADNAELKATFSSVIKDDLLNNNAHQLVVESSEALDSHGYKNQGFPREINFFYMEDGLRERIVKKEERYEVLNTDLRFSEAELLNLVENSPENFSPNVIMRPLYQETVLPNLAYIGGPAEIAYWLQLKSVFEHYKTNFPILMPRNFGLVVNKTSTKRLEKLEIPLKNLFLPIHELKQKFVEQHVEDGIHLLEEKEILREAFEKISTKAERSDKSLKGFVEAECTKTLKSVENISKRLLKAEEKNQEISVKQLENLKEKLFPGGGLQERKENILNFSINNPDIIQFFIDSFDPFDFRFNVIMEEN